MSTFDKREDAFEKKFAHDEQLRFKAEARRDKLLAAWAAAKLGKQGAAVDAYMNEVLVADLAGPGEANVFAKIRGDFDQAGIGLSDHQIHRKMDELLQQAAADVSLTG